jgi:glycosyltransferase involved in cell wall biosynthesis
MKDEPFEKPSADTAAGPHPHLKVLVIMPLAEQRGGSEVALLQLFQSGKELGVTWSVIFLENGPMVAQAAAYGVEARVIAAGRLREPHRVAATIIRIARILSREKFDLVLGWMAKSHLYGGPAAILARVPAIWFQLGSPDPRNWMDRVANGIRARGILTCSQAMASAQAVLNSRTPVLAVHLGVEVSRFDPGAMPPVEEVRRRLGLPVGVPIVGIVGRLQRWKGIHVLIEAMPTILREFPDARCVVVGGVHDLEPDYPAFLDQRIDALDLKQVVAMVGLQRNIPEWIQAMDVFVHASDHEPFGLVVIEGMAMGKPVIAGSGAGPAEIITPGIDGFLTPFGDAGALAEAVLRYLRNPALGRSIGDAARRRALDFSVERYTQKLVAAIRDLLGNHPASPPPSATPVPP